MKKEGWLKHPINHWTLRFHLDKSSWIKKPFIFVDKGRAMPDNQPPLLKSRQRIVKTDAIKLWKRLQREGWKQVTQQW